jgi:hypothetical protein
LLALARVCARIGEAREDEWKPLDPEELPPLPTDPEQSQA